MRFTAFKEFRTIFPHNAIDDVLEYLKNDLKKFLREVDFGLTKLSFTDNFESFQTTVTIPSMTEVAIRNELNNGVTPSRKIILRGKDGAQNVVDGDADWTQNFVYLKNTGASAIEVTVLFMR